MSTNLFLAEQLTGIKDGSFGSVNELEAHTTKINHALARGYFNLHTHAQQGKVELTPHAIYGNVHKSHIEHEDLLKINAKHLENRVMRRGPEIAKLNVMYAQADQRAEQYLKANPRMRKDPVQANIIKATARFLAFDSPSQFVFDIDNTITIDEGTYYDRTVPGTPFCDPPMSRLDRSIFEKVYPAGWGITQEQFPETFKSAGELTILRPGINELQSELIKTGHAMKILTAGMEPLAEGILSQLRMRSFIKEVRSIKLHDVNANNKPLSIRDMACDDEDRSLVFVGDGGSDAPLAQGNLPIGFYFALAGGKFETELTKADLLHFSYEDHHDVLHTMGKIWETAELLGDFLRPAEEGQLVLPGNKKLYGVN